MQHITAVGFDMDYTLAIYKPETFEVLAYTFTCEKLVNVYGYPRDFEYRYDHEYMVRVAGGGQEAGNILKWTAQVRQGCEARVPAYGRGDSNQDVQRHHVTGAWTGSTVRITPTWTPCFRWARPPVVSPQELKERLIERGAEAGGLTEVETALTTKPFIDVYPRFAPPSTCATATGA